MIRLAQLSDANEVAQIHVKTWQAAYQGIIPDTYLDSLSVENREGLWRQAIESGYPELWVMEVESNIIGWVAFGSSRDSDAGPEIGEVLAIYVLPSFWSTGAGRGLWTKAMARLSDLGFQSITLWVLTGNKRAIDFYSKSGFKPEDDAIKEVEVAGKVLQEIRYTKKND
ncbi:L-amino acid N-acyltransferase YncA [Sinobacterium caligoides]|uniref:L-amino acid N-acyltransferase YncA n=1 Tax=Sinobacterium caligoides TaxID=933926 RepID=A0A3N2DDU2_9GAMM|nr:GNAT family N-acetyltransferase [Sinobacterium caligoides]ROR97902.1 L-amino acid N-acyltransferase YncA [Sinobacterium caligoides]